KTLEESVPARKTSNLGFSSSLLRNVLGLLGFLKSLVFFMEVSQVSKFPLFCPRDIGNGQCNLCKRQQLSIEETREGLWLSGRVFPFHCYFIICILLFSPWGGGWGQSFPYKTRKQNAK
ncbi:UNVERIFIED_CONTAM: hypothetical protein K2H54_020546, partial [Gekko kuhli]